MESHQDLSLRLQAILQTTVDGILTIDEQGHVEFVNPATCKIFGYSESEMIGQNINMLMPSPYHENHNGYLENYRTTGVKRIIGIGREVVGKRKDGTLFPFWLSVSEATLDGRLLFTGVVHDVSAQKRDEELAQNIHADVEDRIDDRTEKLSDLVNKLLATNRQYESEVQERKSVENSLQIVQAELRIALQKEQEMGELKSRFVSMASHEFRTPLSTILSSADLMAAYKTAEDQPKRERHYQKIRSAVDNLNTILNDFLSLSRLEEGQVEVQKEEVFLKDFCNEVFEEAKGFLKPRQTLIGEDHLPPHFSALLNKKILHMALINLISNASKYSGEGSQITCFITSPPLRIAVRDEGIGVPDADKPYIFDRFFRASNATIIKGTGLGLNIVSRYLGLLGGVLSFESVLDKGSTFTIEFSQEVYVLKPAL